MKKKKLMQTCMSLLLACSLLLGPTSSVHAENEPWGRGQETISLSDSDSEPDLQNERQQDGISEEDITDGAGWNTSVSGKDANAGESGIDDDGSGNMHTDMEGTSADSKTDGRENVSESCTDTDMKKESESEILPDDENPDKTPYREILSDEDLVLVTVEQRDGAASEEVAMETVEELSETELDALEEYIEDQGYAVTKAAMLASAPTVEIRTITFNMNGFISMAAEGYGSGYDAMFYVDSSNCKGNGNAYCIDPSVQAPGHNSQGVKISYTTTVRDYTDPMLVKIMYYGFGGLGDITGSHAAGGPARHILTHMVATRRAAELGIPGAGNYTYRANQYAVSKADTLYNAIRSMPDITGRVSVLTPVPGQQTIMLLADYAFPPREEKPVLTELKVKKFVSGTGGNKNTDFHFELIITDPSGKTDKKTFTLQHGQEKTFKDLPVGYAYTVKELDGENLGYTVKSEYASGTLTEKPVEVTFTNSREMIVPTGVSRNTGVMEDILMVVMAATFFIIFLRKQKNSRKL